MNKLFLIAAFTALLTKSFDAAVVSVDPVTVTANSVTVTANAAAAVSSIASAVANNNGSSNSAASSNSNSSNGLTSGNNSSSNASSSGNASKPEKPGSLSVTQDQFMKAWTNSKQYLPDANINPPTADQYQAFISNAGPGGGITSNTELAMFLAEIMWESGGLIYKSELACKTNNCAGSYDDGKGAPGKYYYGRGYMQLTWEYNYADASKDLYGDDRLFQNPDQVATNEDVAWGVSYWFWKSRVKPKLNGTYNFGLATDAINGGLECRGADPTKAKKRYQIYVEILKVFEPSATPIEAGCYN